MEGAEIVFQHYTFHETPCSRQIETDLVSGQLGAPNAQRTIAGFNRSVQSNVRLAKRFDRRTTTSSTSLTEGFVPE